MLSFLQEKRLAYKPMISPVLEDLTQAILIPGAPSNLSEEIAKLFPKTHLVRKLSIQKEGEQPATKLTIGVFFSGGPAAGGHNVLAGLYDGIKQIHPDSSLIGFIDGPKGLVENRCKVLESSHIDSVRNQGGWLRLRKETGTGAQ